MQFVQAKKLKIKIRQLDLKYFIRQSHMKLFRKDIPKFVEKTVNDTLGDDQDKFSIMAPALEGDIQDADALNQSRDKAVFISTPRILCSVVGIDKEADSLVGEIFRNRKRQHSSQETDREPS